MAKLILKYNYIYPFISKHLNRAAFVATETFEIDEEKFSHPVIEVSHKSNENNMTI